MAGTNVEMRAGAILEAKDTSAGAFASFAANAHRLADGITKVENTAKRAGRQANLLSRASNHLSKGALGMAARYAAPAAIAYGTYKAYTHAAAFERQMTRVGLTAGATRQEMKGVAAEARNLADTVAMPVDNIVAGYDALAAQGREINQIREMMPAVARAAQASGAAVDDLANSAGAVSDQMHIAGKDMEKAFDLMVAGGQEGKFELKDMARYLPSLAPLAAQVGMTGTEGLRKLVVMLQTVRNQTGTAEEAATNLQNVFQKMQSQATVAKFLARGIDVRRELKKARKEGKDLLDVYLALSEKALRGDLSQVPLLFNDQQMARGMLALLSQKEFAEKVNRAMDGATGSVARNLDTVLKDQQADVDRLGNSWDRLSNSVGKFASAVGVPQLMQGTANFLEQAAKGADIITGRINEKGPSEAELQKQRDREEAGRAVLNEFREREAINKVRADLEAKVQEYRDEADLSKPSPTLGIWRRWRQGINLQKANKAQAELDSFNAKIEARDEASVALALARRETRRVEASSATIAKFEQKPHFVPIKGGVASFMPGAPMGVNTGGYQLPGTMPPQSVPLPPPRPAEAPVMPASSIATIEQAIGGKVEAVVKPDQVVAKVEGQADVHVSVDVKVEPSGRLLAVTEQHQTTTAASRGILNVTGAGNTGVSAPERE